MLMLPVFTLSLWTEPTFSHWVYSKYYKKAKMRSQSPTGSEEGIYETYMKPTADGEYELYDTEYRLDSMYNFRPCFLDDTGLNRICCLSVLIIKY